MFTQHYHGNWYHFTSWITRSLEMLEFGAHLPPIKTANRPAKARCPMASMPMTLEVALPRAKAAARSSAVSRCSPPTCVFGFSLNNGKTRNRKMMFGSILGIQDTKTIIPKMDTTMDNWNYLQPNSYSFRKCGTNQKSMKYHKVSLIPSTTAHPTNHIPILMSTFFRFQPIPMDLPRVVHRVVEQLLGPTAILLQRHPLGGAQEDQVPRLGIAEGVVVVGFLWRKLFWQYKLEGNWWGFGEYKKKTKCNLEQ